MFFIITKLCFSKKKSLDLGSDPDLATLLENYRTDLVEIFKGQE